MKAPAGLKDPICGMSVSEFTGLKLEHKGKIYYFCGEACRNRFLAAEAAKASA